MQIYKYSMVRYIKMYSTWILLFISIILLIIMGIIFPFVLKSNNWFNYEINSMLSIILSFITIVITGGIFLGLKTCQLFKSEVEDGSFLLLLSKPISRKQIFLEKWLAILTMITIYSFANVFIYVLLILVVDPLSINNSNSISNKIWMIGFLMFFLVMLINLLITTLTFLISSKFSTIITFSIISTLTMYIPISSTTQIIYDSKYDTLSTTLFEVNTFNLSSTTIDFINNMSIDLQLQQMITSNSSENTINLWNDTIDTISSSNNYMNNISIEINDKNPYDYAFYLDAYNFLGEIAVFSFENEIKSRHSLLNKKQVVDQNLNKSNIISKISHTMNQYYSLVNDDEYKKNFYLLMDIIFKLRDIQVISEPTNDTNYKENLKNLFETINKNKEQGTFEDFIENPLLSSIYYAKKEKNIDNNIRNELSIFEKIVSLKLTIDLGFGTKLLFDDEKIKNIYYEHNLSLLKTDVSDSGEIIIAKDSEEYVNSFINNIDENSDFNDLIWKSFLVEFNGYVKTNNQAIVDILNVIRLEQDYGIDLFSIKQIDYVNKWVLLSICLTTPFVLFALSYFVYIKKDFR